MLAVAGGKGGCGKTTTALGVATVLAERGPVTVVDGDVDMPDLHVVAETPARPGIDALTDGASVDACRHDALEYPGVSIVPAGEADRSIERALERIGSVDGFLVVDTPAGASVDVTRPLRVADGVLLVSTPTRRSLVDVTKSAEIARAVGTPIVGLVVNRSDGRVDPSPLFECPVLAHVPTVDATRPALAERSTFRSVVRSLDKRNT